ncbi:hypothetical protein [Endozoicomonas numazuensis]|uniref:Uncharacterized protein n=1 Tax=Endozoicomonas numazuensis TaxID=1137799 RepID=A0A081NL46_9GAMM|nr:hypothetical protein [Endozoicomonas numazuensis]KEQ19169.1 hypothetical protein GZ78_04005 [Endozoicomonas numazuensis]
MEAVSHLLAAQPITPKGQAEFEDDLAAWGVQQSPEPKAEVFDVWEEHREALLWWCQGGAQLKFNSSSTSSVCTGLDVVALKADADLSGRTVKPEDYHRMQLIAREVAEHLNSRAAVQG